MKAIMHGAATYSRITRADICEKLSEAERAVGDGRVVAEVPIVCSRLSYQRRCVVCVRGFQ